MVQIFLFPTGITEISNEVIKSRAEEAQAHPRPIYPDLCVSSESSVMLPVVPDSATSALCLQVSST
jgi:hypothetical protein